MHKGGETRSFSVSEFLIISDTGERTPNSPKGKCEAPPQLHRSQIWRVTDTFFTKGNHSKFVILIRQLEPDQELLLIFTPLAKTESLLRAKQMAHGKSCSHKRLPVLPQFPKHLAFSH